MTPLFGFMGMFLGWTMSLLSIFLILLVLVQRGRGGGLTGALGGPGGQSAFGSKAGDMFTKITSGTALLWIALCALATASLGEPPLPADDFAEDDVPALISEDPADIGTLSFPADTEPGGVSPGPGDASLSPAPAAAESTPAESTPAESEPAADSEAPSQP